MDSASFMRSPTSGQRECNAETARGNSRTCKKNCFAKIASPPAETSPREMRHHSGWPPKLRPARISCINDSANPPLADVIGASQVDGSAVDHDRLPGDERAHLARKVEHRADEVFGIQVSLERLVLAHELGELVELV